MPVARLLFPAFFGSLLVMLWWGLFTILHDVTQLAQKGRTTAAQVTAKHRTFGRSRRYYVDYRFNVGSKVVEGSQSVPEETYMGTAEGSQQTITYLPSDPNLQRLGTVSKAQVADTQRIGFVALSFLTLIFGALIWYVEHYYRT